MLYITYDNASIAHNDVIQSQFANFSVQLSYHTWWSEVTRLHYLLGLIFRALFLSQIPTGIYPALYNPMTAVFKETHHWC